MESQRVLKAGFFAFDGYHIEDADGRRSGFGYDFLQLLGRYGDWSYEYIGYDKSWSEMQDMLASGAIDILTSAQKTPERESRFAFSDKAIGTSSAILTVKSGDDRYTIGDYATYNGMRVGLLRDSTRNDSLAVFAAENGFSYVPVYCDSAAEMEESLQSGAVDALLSSNLRLLGDELVLDEFAPSDFYVMVRKDDAELLAAVNQAIDQMDINLTDWRHELWNKYYASSAGTGIAFTAREKAFLDQAAGQPIRAIINPDRAPYTYFREGSPAGIIPEIFSQISGMTGLSFEIVETKSREEYFRALAEDKGITVRIDAYDDYYLAEQQGFKLTSPYISASVAVVSRRSASEPYSSVALVREADQTAYRAAALASGAKISWYDTIGECLDAVRDGNAAAAYVLSYTAQRYLNDNDLGGVLKSTLLPQYSIAYAIAVADTADGRLLTVLDKAVRHLNSGSVESAIISETEDAAHRMTLREYFSANPLALAASVGAAALLFIMAAVLIIRRKSLRLIEEKNRELQAEALRADKASEAKSQFLSSMSHDMRTPLNGVISFTNFARQADSLEKKQEYIEKAGQSAAILMSLINDTLEVSRIESGKMELHPEWVRIRELIGGISLVIGEAAREKGLSFTAEDGFREADCAYVDKLKLQDILMNLLTNAVKYTPTGGAVTLAVGYDQDPADGYGLRIVVSDNGIGISGEFLPKLYEPFAQERIPALKGVSGTGLGLYIVRRIVTLMNGTINCASTKGQGTVMTVTLPLQIEERREVKTAAVPVFDFRGRKVLLCEDNYVNTEIATTILSEKGITVTAAPDGKAGTEIFAASAAGEFSAILMDIHMPVWDGYEATRRIRSLSRADAQSVPIIAMTADAYQEDIERCLACGMNGHIAKPIDPDRLFAELAKALEKRAGQAF